MSKLSLFWWLKLFSLLFVLNGLLIGCSGGGSSTTVNTADKTPPIITLLGANPTTLLQNSIYKDAGATATDDQDGVITVTSVSTVNTAVVGEYTVIYSAKDKAGNQAQATRTVVISSGKAEVDQLIDETKALLNSNTPPMTNEQFAQTELAKNPLPDDVVRRLERAHDLVAIAEDPDPTWFGTLIDKPVLLAEPGKKYTVQVRKVDPQGLDLGPVDINQLLLVVRVQRGDHDFEYVNNNFVDQFAKWLSPGVLELTVPADLQKGRLLVGIRPNFEDVAKSAIAERWSNVISAEVWPKKAGVQTVESSNVLFPVMAGTEPTLDTTSQFSLAEISALTTKQLADTSDVTFPLVLKASTFKVGDLVAYELAGKPYAGKVLHVQSKGEQQLVLLTPEWFEVFDITDGDNDFLVKEGLFPENVIYRQGDGFKAVENESDPIKFAKASALVQPANALSNFFREKCKTDSSIGKSVLTFKFDVAPFEGNYGIDVKLHFSPEEISCTWEAHIGGVQVPLVLGGPVALLSKFFGTGIVIDPVGEFKVSTKLPALGINVGANTNTGGYMQFGDPLFALLELGSTNLSPIAPSEFIPEAELGYAAGFKATLNAISVKGALGKVLALSGIKLEALGIDAKAVIKAALAGSFPNAQQILDLGKASSVAAKIELVLSSTLTPDTLKLLNYFKIDTTKIGISKKFELLPLFKSSPNFGFKSVFDNQNGIAVVRELALETSFIKALNRAFQTEGVLAPTNKSSSVFNDATDLIQYEVTECELAIGGVIKSPVIACNGLMCATLPKTIELCQGKIAIGDVFIQALSGQRRQARVRLTNKNPVDITVAVTGVPNKPLQESLFIRANSSAEMLFAGECGTGAAYGRTTIRVTAPAELNEQTDSAENLLGCFAINCVDCNPPPPAPTDPEPEPPGDDGTGFGISSSIGTGTIFGDPHIVTTDRLAYDYYASGDYILSRVPGVGGYEIQGRFLPGFQTSWPQALAIKVGADTIEVQGVQTDGHGDGSGVPLNKLIVWVNGEATIGHELNSSRRVFRLPAGGLLLVNAHATTGIARVPEEIAIFWPRGSQTESYSARIRVSQNSTGLKTAPFVSIQLTRNANFRGLEQGLLGNHNGDPSDDLQRRNGEILVADGALSFTELYGLFGADWLVRPLESLFRNPNAIKPIFPSTTVTLTDAQRIFAEEACKALQGFYREACIMDVGLTGDVDLVRQYYANTTDLNDIASRLVIPPAPFFNSSLTAARRVFNADKSAFTQLLTVTPISGDGSFRLVVRPPRARSASFKNGLTSQIGSGLFSAEVAVNCKDTNVGTDSELFPVQGEIQLWGVDPLSGGDGRLFGSVALPCTLSSIPKTGLTLCYDFSSNFEETCTEEHLGQDGYYATVSDQGIEPTISHVDTTIKDLEPIITTLGVQTENFGELQWDVIGTQLSRDSKDGLRSTLTEPNLEEIFSFYEPASSGTSVGRVRALSKFCSSFHETDLSGYRLPTVRELSYILNYEGNPATLKVTDTEFLKNPLNNKLVFDGKLSFPLSEFIGFGDAYLAVNSEGTLARVVRGHNTLIVDSFHDDIHFETRHSLQCVNGQGVVIGLNNDVDLRMFDLDNDGVSEINSGGVLGNDELEWHIDPAVPLKTWQQAIEFCEKLSDGVDDWRLPNMYESMAVPMKDLRGVGSLTPFYWTSTTHVVGFALPEESRFGTAAATFSPVFGLDQVGSGIKTRELRTVCVRDK